jgi:large repetitive protein
VLRDVAFEGWESMTAIFFGAGTGLERNTAWYLGARAQMGDPSLGRAADQVRVNAANGNLVIQNNDEIVIGRGPDSAIGRTYNSQGAIVGETDNWWTNTQRKIEMTSKTPLASGSKFKLTDWDGTEVIFSLVAGQNYYKTADPLFDDYRDDRVTYDNVTKIFTWVDNKTGTVQKFQYFDAANLGRLISVDDAETGVAADRNTVTYEYDSTAATGKLIKITTRIGTTGVAGSEQGHTNFTTLTYWAGTTNIKSLTTSWLDKGGATPVVRTLTRTNYVYDASNRLTSVSVDLSPDDSATTDGKIYTTNYAYVGTTKRIAAIAQSDGSSLSMTYDASGRVTQLNQITETGITRTTLFTYNAAGQMITYTDALGNVTTMAYDASGRVTRIAEPAPASGSNARITTIVYDSLAGLASTTLGTVVWSSDIRVFDGAANETAGIYLTRDYRRLDDNGNLIEQGSIVASDGATGPEQANIVRRTFNANNQATRESLYVGVDADGPGLNAPTEPLTTRYVYDAERHLRFAVSAEGRVMEYVYDAPGQLISTIDYADNFYPTAALAENATLTEAQLTTWTGGIANKSGVERTDTAYDFRGNVLNVTSYSKALATGAGDGASPFSRTHYVYDQYGKLLKRLVEGATQPKRTSSTARTARALNMTRRTA